MMEIKLILLSEVDLAEQSQSPCPKPLMGLRVVFKETTEQLFY